VSAVGDGEGQKGFRMLSQAFSCSSRVRRSSSSKSFSSRWRLKTPPFTSSFSLSGAISQNPSNSEGNLPEKLADAEIHLTAGPLDGLNLIGLPTIGTPAKA